MPPAIRPAINPWFVTIIISMATFMEVLDTSVANVSLSHIAGGLASSLDEATWVLTSYLVTNAIMMPISGWFGTVFGLKRFFMVCVAIFTISSLLCGLAPSLGWLVFFRVLQGVGGAGMVPVVQAMLADLFPAEKRGMAFSVYGLAVVFAPAIGPTLGGWITDNYSWHWIFLINIPVGIVSLFLTAAFVYEPDAARIERTRVFKARGFRVDWPGFALTVLGIGCLEMFVDRGQRLDWFASNFITAMAVISGVSLVALVWWELRQKNPMVDIALLKVPSFFASFLAMFALGFVLFGTTVLMPQFLQQLLGYTAQQSGMALTAGGIVMIFMMPLVGGFFVHRFQARHLVIAGLLMEAASLYFMGSTFSLGTTFDQAVWGRVFQTLGLAFLFIPIMQSAYLKLPPGKNANAAALINLARNLGGSVGIAVSSTLLAQRSQFHQSRMVEHVSSYDPQTQIALRHIGAMFSGHGADSANQALGMIYTMVQRQAGMLSYIEIFYLMAAGILLVIPLTFLLPRNDPHPRDQPAPAH
ncbi:MAG: DHA2 family efflux MFS transporter permease subunit [Terrimicrobiaceae bacterium]|nr:DHA2 family efflux MFS transporter permease subunit [Terrimicrobiaceae bacterium]